VAGERRGGRATDGDGPKTWPIKGQERCRRRTDDVSDRDRHPKRGATPTDSLPFTSRARTYERTDSREQNRSAVDRADLSCIKQHTAYISSHRRNSTCSWIILAGTVVASLRTGWGRGEEGCNAVDVGSAARTLMGAKSGGICRHWAGWSHQPTLVARLQNS